MTPRKPTRAYSYLRFSTPEQSKGDSTRRQTDLAARYAAREGLELDTTLKMSDRGVSAHQGKNLEVGAALGDFMEAVRAGEVPQGSYLLLENLDRFSRFEPIEAMASFKRLCEMGVNVVTLYNERVFTAQLLRRDMMAIMELAFTFGRASEESEVKARRLKASWENKRAQADTKKLTARCPAWLSLDSDRNGFTINEERAAIVQRIYGETLQGCSPHSIAFALNTECVPVFGRGKHWHRSYVVKILDNASVIGTMTPHTIGHTGGKRTRSPEAPIEDYYPAIIQKAIYQRVQSMRATHSPMRGRHAGKEVTNIFAGGLVRCARCGGTLARLNKGKGTKGGVYLVCSVAKSGAGCEYETVHYQQIEDIFLDNVPQLVAKAPTGDKNKKLDKQISALEAGIEGTETALENLLNSLASSRSPAVERRVRETESGLDEMKASLHALQMQSADASGPIVRSRLKDMLETATAEPLNRTHLNAMLRQNLASVELDFASRSLLISWKQGGTARVVVGMPK